jgi:NitT/TauT family transport system permease protein
MVQGICAMVGLIWVMDFLIWRPILSWVQRFRLEEIVGGDSQGPASAPWMEIVIRESRIVRFLKVQLRRWRFADREKAPVPVGVPPETLPAIVRRPQLEMQRMRRLIGDFAAPRRPLFSLWLGRAVLAAFTLGLVWGSWQLLQILLAVPPSTWAIILRNTFWTFLRVSLALILGSLWAVPTGIWLGTNARRLRIAQPIIQILASFPAPMLYPLALAIFFKLHISFSWGSMLLMLLGVQWYILFNVLAGALRVPRELLYALDLMETPRWLRWRMLYIPSVFPALVTGWVTAAGGAWNASMVAEVVTYQGHVLRTGGLGATITGATESGDFQVLAASLAVMVTLVILLNRLVWSPIYRLAQTRFRMDM